MALISEADAIQILGYRIYDFRDVMVAAWDEYLGIAPRHRLLLCSTTRAGIVHDFIKQRVRERFGDDSSAHVVEVNKMLVVVINQRLVVRFKLFHPDKTSSNIRTGQVKDYREQRDIPELRNQLDLIGELSNLEAGYILDQLESEIRETWLVCPSGLCASAWKHEIRNTDVATGVPEPSAAPLFPSPTTIVLPRETTVVTFKRTDKGRETS